MRGELRFGLLVVMLICISSFTVFAYEKIYDDYIYNFDTFELEEDLYYAQISNDLSQIVLQKNDKEAFFINNGTCEDTTYYSYCFNGTFLDYEDYGRPIPNTLIWEPAIRVVIYSKKPTIKITRDFDKEINVDERVVVSYEIENTGILPISNIIYREPVPSNAKLDVGPLMSVEGDNVVYSLGLLNRGETRTFSYAVRPVSYDSIGLEAGNLTFHYEDLDFSSTVKSGSIKINNPINHKLSMSAKEVGVQEEFTLTYTITNDDWNDHMDVTFDFDLPEGVIPVRRSPQVPKETPFSYNFDLAPEESHTFEIDLKSNLENVYSIIASTTIEIRNDVFQETFVNNVSVSLPKLIPQLTLSKNELFEGGAYSILLTIENPSNINYKDVVAQLSSPFINKRFNYSQLSAGREITLFNDVLRGPSVINETTFNISFFGHYKSPSLQVFRFSESELLKVKPVSVGYEIDKTVSKLKVIQGDLITIGVSAKNIGQKIGVLDVKENIPAEFTLETGLTSKKLTVDIGDTEDFYDYKVRVNRNAKPGTYNISTDLFDETNLLSLSESTLVEISENKTEEVVEEVPQEIIEEKETSFIRGILDFFIAIFR